MKSVSPGAPPGGPRLAVVDSGIGNLRSAEKALQRVGADARLVDDPSAVAAADGVVLPGVGAFGRCREALAQRGLDRAVLDAVARRVPLLGICVGLQLLYEGSEESPGSAGLGVLPGVVRRLPAGVKHPQMQWNRLEVLDPACPLLSGPRLAPPAEAWVYFVHSYAARVGPETVATCDYGGPVAAVVARDRLWATQFHPEKSGAVGLAVLAAFVAEVGRLTAVGRA
ncbi:MAG TPA: imidazole glycerol phosphate synthase subunit HisH [Acidimicrobiales bacterium]|nr:imidazole glycerol phosphate synthase subunit HisH [Acidimicrobiales bacterium]